MDSVVDWYKQMAIGDDEEELNLDEGEVESSPVDEAAIGFPVIGQVLIDCKVKFPDLKETTLSLWRPGKGAMTTSSPSLSPPLVGRSQRKKFLRGGRYGRLKQRSKWRTPWLWTEQKIGRRQALLHKPVEDVGCRMEVTRQRDSSGVMAASGVFFILLCLLLQ
ncbi:unnamed protein product [Cuscuta epithymum]|uniref:Uncharacterized protein n=1 Tax=Cuscuta epithymum TaxID=186058 RepID=A0AAV0E798_9ASTE|nr:unnamed protein product [Cuscuta epithymum]